MDTRLGGGVPDTLGPYEKECNFAVFLMSGCNEVIQPVPGLYPMSKPYWQGGGCPGGHN